MTAKFIHFRTQSSYSMLESAIKVDALTDLALQHDMPAVALTDRGNLFASLEFALSATKKKIQPIQGVLLNIKFTENSFTDSSFTNSSFTDSSFTDSSFTDSSFTDSSFTNSAGNDNIGKDQFAECLLLAKNNIGYKNLLKLVSNTFIKNDRSICEHISITDLEEANEGLVFLSAYTDGVIGKLLLQSNFIDAKAAANNFKRIFGDRFYFEIMRHDDAIEQQIENEYLALANELQIPLIATNKVLFSDISMHDAHDVLLCISEGVVKEQENRKRVSDQCYFKSANEMIELFPDLPEAIENTLHLAKRCYIMAETHPPSLPNFTTATSTTSLITNNSSSDTNINDSSTDTNDAVISEEELIRKEAAKGLKERLELKFASESIDQKDQTKIRDEYFARLNYELDIICKMQFSGYFLIVSDFICWSKQNGIAVGPGRGSGAGSIIAWALKITDLDPIKFGLLFERFLNPERVSMPDFDIDFCQERREEVIEYVRNKYGDERVGQIITFGKMQAKAVIKDVSRVLELPYKFADQLTELVPFNAVNPVKLTDAIRDVGELKNAAAGKGLYNLTGENELIKQVLDTAIILEGLHRHASTHAAGIVIANSNMIETVPLYKDKLDSNLLIVQYSMKYCELAGLVKFDFLGLQTLTVITKCLHHLEKQGIHIDMDKLAYDDEKTYELLAKGLSTGVFQFESAGMKSAIKKLKPDCIEDIIALGALYRPGPMENIPTYIACKHGQQEPDYLHPLLEPILQETNGVIIYQEQVMEIAKILAGYSLGAADLLRRAMGKKVKAEMDAQEEIFVSGAIANKVDAKQAKSIFATVAKFAGYGFNKSHASAYGVISYQTAYLKANFPVEFLVACLNLDIDSSDKINIFLQEAKILRIDVLPPSINHSCGDFKIKFNNDDNANSNSNQNGNNSKSIIFAIGAIKNVSKNFGKYVEEERNKSGPFKTISNFLERTPPKLLNKRLLENIIRAGCFDELYENRNSLLNSVPAMLNYCNSYHVEKHSNQMSLINVNQASGNIITEATPFTKIELAIHEFEVFGLFLGNHPLQDNFDMLIQMDIKTSTHIRDVLDNGSYALKLAGVVVKKDSRMSQRGRFITLLLSDPFGIYEVTIFSEDILKEYANLINVKSEVVIECDIFKDDGGVRITAKRFHDLKDFSTSISHDLNLYPRNQHELQEIITLLEKAKSINNEKSNSRITIFLEQDNGYIAKTTISENLFIELDDLQYLQQFRSYS